MGYLFLIPVFLVLLIIGTRMEQKARYGSLGGILLAIFSATAIFVCLFLPSMLYSTTKDLPGIRIGVLTTCKSVDRVKQAYYPTSNIISPTLVSGSIENLSQSKAWSEAIMQCAKEKKDFNQSLTTVKFLHKSKFGRWFTSTSFANEEILALELIE